ncbi:sugar transferase [Cytobacillus purgationiresistens]|uniref:Sugar transferase EpsL n=1 Tax=Cytobacillus purgationiresistens TaxID=863449 RepID=A0ABU0AI84_9BACI|nr:sugar transferase [Cytobacillus purgationiresistens]MDQ0270932.1 sugar transferase EpsL [Cytobacillus purgationiresistens]
MKRCVDIVSSLIILVILSPFIFLIAWLVRIKLGSPIFFKQPRPGLYTVPFNLYKFRTMTDERDRKGDLLADEHRLTSFGRILRKYSIDELPQFINVLKGDLSLVGPRPLLMQYLPLYTFEQAARHNVKPGITGWAQINGRNAISWEEKFALDVWYVNNQTILLDLKILAITMKKVIQSEGINQSGNTTVENFKGSQPISKKMEG